MPLSISKMRKNLLTIFFTLHLINPITAQKFERDSTFRKTPIVGLIAPLALIGGGIVLSGQSFKDDQLKFRNKNFPNFDNRLDDLMQFSSHGAVFALDWIGVKSKHNFKDKLGLMAMGGVIALGTVNALKYTTDVVRPDGSSANSFPSGHTANAFFGATILAEEYRDQSIWYAIGGYSIATATGVFRMLNNRHWVADVAVGAGIGTLSGKAAYIVYPWVKEKLGKNKYIKNVTFIPLYDGISTGGSLVIGF